MVEIDFIQKKCYSTYESIPFYTNFCPSIKKMNVYQDTFFLYNYRNYGTIYMSSRKVQNRISTKKLVDIKNHSQS